MQLSSFFGSRISGFTMAIEIHIEAAWPKRCEDNAVTENGECWYCLAFSGEQCRNELPLGYERKVIDPTIKWAPEPWEKK